MDPALLRQIGELAGPAEPVWIGTVGADGRPHLATAGGMSVRDDGRIVLREWFCPATLENARVHPAAVSVVVWPGGEADGLQLLGQVEEIREYEIMDGFDPATQGKEPLPQAQRGLVIRVDQVLRFHRGPHTDKPEREGT